MQGSPVTGTDHHEKLMHRAIDAVCARPSRNLDAGTDSIHVRSVRFHLLLPCALNLTAISCLAVPRAGEIAALEAYERIVRKALSDGEGEVDVEDRLRAAGIADEQAAAASAAYKSRMPEMRAQMAEAAAQVRFLALNLRESCTRRGCMLQGTDRGPADCRCLDRFWPT